ncbi:MAG: patatin-like phospholipase family protein [Saprospiraceae bacterium]|jgi:NTE family protein|nr:patatin-like phospholipase family protein [Saprospiraceae bacterium]
MFSPTIGLVLSGGGVRGVAHLGLLQVLEEIGIEPVAISGTSAGALVGSLRAAGHSIGTILDFFKTTSIFKMGLFSARKPGFIDTDKFIPVLGELLPEDFSGLQKKLYVTATDMVRGRQRTFSHGPLIRPVLASAAFPVVFTPVEIEGQLYTDGGALNNFPVEPLTGECELVIGSNVHPFEDMQPADIKNTMKVMERLFHLSIHHHSVQKYHMCKVVVAPKELAGFGVFDRSHFDEIFEIGYKAALEKREELEALK